MTAQERNSRHAARHSSGFMEHLGSRTLAAGDVVHLLGQVHLGGVDHDVAA